MTTSRSTFRANIVIVIVQPNRRECADRPCQSPINTWPVRRWHHSISTIIAASVIQFFSDHRQCNLFVWLGRIRFPALSHIHSSSLSINTKCLWMLSLVCLLFWFWIMWRGPRAVSSTTNRYDLDGLWCFIEMDSLWRVWMATTKWNTVSVTTPMTMSKIRCPGTRWVTDLVT